jgi:hypothetical protein
MIYEFRQASVFARWAVIDENGTEICDGPPEQAEHGKRIAQLLGLPGPGTGWIGVDFDGTLAHYKGWNDGKIGPPIPAMLHRVLNWLNAGREVRIVTARAWDPKLVKDVEAWCLEHLGRVIPVTCMKDFGMRCLWDDRAVQVETNEGNPICAPEAFE